MSLPERHRFKWTEDEYNQLENEVVNMGLTIEEIAKQHGRTYNAILYKMQDEGYFEEPISDDESDCSDESDSESDDSDDVLYLEFEMDNKSVMTQITAILFILNFFITIYNLYLYH